MPALFNFVAYQIAWFVCVLGAAHELPWLGTMTALAVTAINIAIAARSSIEFKLVAVAACIGLALDSILVTGGFVSFTSGTTLSAIAPHWMIALWASFATTLNVSLRWLMLKPVIAVLFGAIGGPLAYFAGAQLGAMNLVFMPRSLLAIGIGWAIAMYLLSRAVAHFNRSHSFKARFT